MRATSGTTPARCTGTLKLTGRLPGHRKASTLASGRLSFASNRLVTVRVKLSRSALKALRRRSVVATLRVTVRNTPAPSASARKTVRLLRRR